MFGPVKLIILTADIRSYVWRYVLRNWCQFFGGFNEFPSYFWLNPIHDTRHHCTHFRIDEGEINTSYRRSVLFILSKHEDDLIVMQTVQFEFCQVLGR